MKYNAINYTFAIALILISTTNGFVSKIRSRAFIKKDGQRIVLSSTEPPPDVPANLKRKLQAKRPPLGHRIPKRTRTKGSGGSSNPRLRAQGKAREAGMNNPSMLKIIAGTARGRRLDSPNNVYLRPMMGKVREAIFSTLTSFGIYDTGLLPAARHLDLFAGSGSIGLESLSRGTRHGTFCDFSQDCCDAITRNIKWCQFDNESDNEKHYSTRVVCSDVNQLLTNPDSVGLRGDGTDTFDVITLGPPYEEVVYAELLENLANSPLVRDDTIIVLEYPIEIMGDIPHVYQAKPEIEGGPSTKALIGVRNRKYGRTVIAIYICNPTGKFEVAESRPEEFIFDRRAGKRNQVSD